MKKKTNTHMVPKLNYKLGLGRLLSPLFVQLCIFFCSGGHLRLTAEDKMLICCKAEIKGERRDVDQPSEGKKPAVMVLHS